MNTYRVGHIKKGMMEIKAKTSYEAAKIFAEKKKLKGTAGVSTLLISEPISTQFL